MLKRTNLYSTSYNKINRTFNVNGLYTAYRGKSFIKTFISTGTFLDNREYNNNCLSKQTNKQTNNSFFPLFQINVCLNYYSLDKRFRQT